MVQSQYLIDSNTMIDYLGSKLPDAIITAIALVFNLILISGYISDFNNIDGLLVIDPNSL